MENFDITNEGVHKLLKGLNPNKAPGPDQMKPLVLKELADQITKVVTKIFHLLSAKKQYQMTGALQIPVQFTKKASHGLLNIRLDLLPRRPKKKKASLYLTFIHKLYFLFIQILYLLWYFGYGESTGTIFEVRGIVVLRFRRHLMMTSQIYLISS